MKKLMSSLGALAVCFMFTGCCLSHEWQEATCTEPKTCSKCGEVEGEALGHTWVEATCAEPKKCSVCGETEGEALPHTLTEANFQQAAVCTVCNAQVGEPLQADFEKYGLNEYLVELDKEYDCVTMCHEDNSKTTVAKVKFSNYQTFVSGTPEKAGNFTITSELPEEPGYEYRVVDVTFNFIDENAKKYGASMAPCWEDYYDIVGFDESSEIREDGWTQFTVNWNGVDYTECIDNYISEWIDHDDGTFSYNCIYIARVPVGYDGYIIGFRNKQIEYGDEQHIFDIDNTDSVFFRFK